MKHNIHYFILFLVGLLIIPSCVQDEDLASYSQGDLQRNDTYQQILLNTPVVSFVAGEEGYDFEFIVINPGNDDVKKIDAYLSYNVPSTGATSDGEVLLGSYDVPAGQNTATIGDRVTYEQLSSGLTIGGAALPADPVAIPVGAAWSIRLSPVGSDGSELFASSSILVPVLSPFAGNYTVIASDYWRIGVQSGSADWTGETRFIGSVDENTFSHVDGWGPFNPGFGPAVGQFIFDLNEDMTITIPDVPEQLFFSGNDMLTCQEDAAIMVNVPCGSDTNVLIPSADGKHIIKLTYGYFTTGSGPREFYEVLEKQVN